MKLKTASDVARAAAIDDEHGVQLRMVHRVAEAVRAAAEPITVRERLDELVSYTNAHFMFEQLLMRLSAYEEYDAHVLDHERMMERLDELSDRVKADDSVPGIEDIDAILDALVRHIGNRDRAFGEYYREWLQADVSAAPRD